VIGRTESKARLLPHARQPASETAFVSAKKSFTSARAHARDRRGGRGVTQIARGFYDALTAPRAVDGSSLPLRVERG
jgi:hypothetical protein